MYSPVAVKSRLVPDPGHVLISTAPDLACCKVYSSRSWAKTGAASQKDAPMDKIKEMPAIAVGFNVGFNISYFL
jgi:hypothetical protein